MLTLNFYNINEFPVNHILWLLVASSVVSYVQSLSKIICHLASEKKLRQ